MDRERLERHLAAGRSLEAIGHLEGKHASTIGYWIKKHGLVANGRAEYSPKGGIPEGRLRDLVDRGLTVREIAEETGVGYSTARHWLARFGLRTKPTASDDRFSEARGRGLRHVDAECRHHGDARHVLRSDGLYRCARCSSESVARRRRRVKQILVEEAGGSCAICGYDRCLAALQFHHLDPSKKEFVISRRGNTRSINELRCEAAKCALLCANCHAEIERGLVTLPPE